MRYNEGEGKHIWHDLRWFGITILGSLALDIIDFPLEHWIWEGLIGW